jgi:3-oxoadipate enol-lactonase
VTDLPAVYARGVAGAPLMFLHGVGGDHSAWRPQLLHFADRYRVFAWDMPGYGASPPPRSMAFPELARSLAALLDSLELPKVHLIGQSLGGMVAQEFAASFPERLSSLVLVATSPAFGRPDKDWQQKFLDDRIGVLDRGATMAELAHANIKRIVGRDPDPLGVEIAVSCTANIPVESYKQAVRMIVGFDRREALGRIAVPTLAIAGEVDTVAPAPMMQKMAGQIAGCQFVSIAKSGHLANLEQPIAFNQTLGAFLATHSGGS